MYRTNHPLKSGSFVLFVAACVIVAPSVASANVGTPLIWFTLLHLYIGNACIGILEGWLLARFFRAPASRAFPLMILANYFSAWVGWLSLSPHFLRQFDVTLYNVQFVVWVMIAVAYIATLVMEWPFVFASLWGTEKPLRRSLIASLFVQSISYVLLFGWYGMVSVNSMFSELTIVPPDQIALPADVRLYFIDAKDGDVYAMELGTRQITKVFDLNSRDDHDCLSFDNTNSPTGFHDIVALLGSWTTDDPKPIDLGVTVFDGDCPQSPDRWSLLRRRYPSPSEGTAPRLGTAVNSPWTFKAGYWALQGLSGENAATGERMHFAMELPYFAWNVRHATHLPSDQILFELGNRQICILDLNSRKIAILCLGRGLLAQLEE